jgi:two-component system chemotaxis response regulator CheY
MKKILIVDDNENNRMLLRALLEDYAEDNDVDLNIREAVNGLEASLVAEDEHFSLILMDIMMPEMDGIEATRRIRACDAKTMIVAVSAVDDGERQRQILRNGAEDYIAKPINADIFIARLGNYFSLIDSRDTQPKRNHPHAVNLFTQEIYARQFNFFIATDDELSEFWEYYLLDSPERSEELSDAVRTMHALASIGLKVGAKLQIMVEESVDKMYISLVGIESIDAKIIKLIMLKNPSVTDYKSDADKFSIRLARPSVSEPVNIVYESVVEPVIVPVTVQAPIVETVNTFEPVQNYAAVQEEIHVYDFLEREDLEDLREYVGKLNSLMLIVGGEVERHEVDEISDNLQYISRICSGYTDSYPIGNALSNMGRTIRDHSDLFVQKSKDIGPMCAAFGRDLSAWLQMIFVDGAPSVHYMDDTIIANVQMLESMLTMDDADHSGSAENLDDIFDF